MYDPYNDPDIWGKHIVDIVKAEGGQVTPSTSPDMGTAQTQTATGVMTPQGTAPEQLIVQGQQPAQAPRTAQNPYGLNMSQAPMVQPTPQMPGYNPLGDSKLGSQLGAIATSLFPGIAPTAAPAPQSAGQALTAAYAPSSSWHGDSPAKPAQGTNVDMSGGTPAGEPARFETATAPLDTLSKGNANVLNAIGIATGLGPIGSAINAGANLANAGISSNNSAIENRNAIRDSAQQMAQREDDAAVDAAYAREQARAGNEYIGPGSSYESGGQPYSGSQSEPTGVSDSMPTSYYQGTGSSPASGGGTTPSDSSDSTSDSGSESSTTTTNGGMGGSQSSSDSGSDSGGYFKGGLVDKKKLKGPNPKGPDQGYAALKGGEFVVSAKAVKKVGLAMLNKINSTK